MAYNGVKVSSWMVMSVYMFLCWLSCLVSIPVICLQLLFLSFIIFFHYLFWHFFLLLPFNLTTALSKSQSVTVCHPRSFCSLLSFYSLTDWIFLLFFDTTLCFALTVGCHTFKQNIKYSEKDFFIANRKTKDNPINHANINPNFPKELISVRSKTCGIECVTGWSQINKHYGWIIFSASVTSNRHWLIFMISINLYCVDAKYNQILDDNMNILFLKLKWNEVRSTLLKLLSMVTYVSHTQIFILKLSSLCKL